MIIAALALVSAGIAAYGSVKAGQDQANALNGEANAQLAKARYEAFNMDQENKFAQRQAEQYAQQIAERARAMAGTQQSQYAASGVVVNTGSAQQILDQTRMLESRDIQRIMYNTTYKRQQNEFNTALNNKAARNVANAKRAQAHNALLGGYMGAAGAIAKGVSSAYASYNWGTSETTETAEVDNT